MEYFGRKRFKFWRTRQPALQSIPLFEFAGKIAFEAAETLLQPGHFNFVQLNADYETSSIQSCRGKIMMICFDNKVRCAITLKINHDARTQITAFPELNSYIENI